MKISIDYDKYLAQQRIVGEMAGALEGVLVSGAYLNKAYIEDLLKRYREVFDDEEVGKAQRAETL